MKISSNKKDDLNAEMSFLISFTSSSVTPSFSAIRCFYTRKVVFEVFLMKQKLKGQINIIFCTSFILRYLLIPHKKS